MTIDLRSQQLSQSQLATLVPAASLLGTRRHHKIVFLLLSLVLIGISGLVGGVLGGKILTDIRFDYQGFRYLSIGLFIIILIGSIRLSQRGILATLSQMIGVSFVWIPLFSLGLLTLDRLQNPAQKMLGGIVLNALDSGFVILCIVVLAAIVQVVRQAIPQPYLMVQGSLIAVLGATASLVAARLSRVGALDNNTLAILRKTVDPPPDSVEVAGLGGLIWTLMVVLGGLQVSNSMTCCYPRFLWLRQGCTAIAAWGGTSFYNLDLSGINFSGANIANTDFRGKMLYRTCLIGLKGIDRARVDRRYLDLDQLKVQRLLTTGIVQEKDFQRTNLQGAFLPDVDLQDVNFTDATLHGANLQGANLRGAWLVRTRVTGVDFSGADLTGCCIKDWSTNRHSDFTRVICNYIYRDFEEGRPCDRYPQDRDFHPGEFAALYRQLDNSVELVFQGVTNLRALDLTLEKFQLEDRGMGLELQGIEQRGDIYVVKVSYRDGASPQQIQQKVYNNFNLFLQQDEGAAYNIVQQMGDIMEGQNISAGGNVDASSGTRVDISGNIAGSTLNLGTISGNVTNSIQQVRESSVQGSQDLAKILDELQTSIQDEVQISDQQKQDALEAVETLAEEAKKPPESRVTKLCSLAMNALTGITTTLSDASKLAEVVKSTLPLLKGLLGLI